MRLVVVAALVALALPSSAAAHLPFREGKRTAAELQRYFARAAQMRDVRCAYRAPHIRCSAAVLAQGLRVEMTITIHRTGARRGYARICAAGSICQNQPLRFSRG